MGCSRSPSISLLLSVLSYLWEIFPEGICTVNAMGMEEEEKFGTLTGSPLRYSEKHLSFTDPGYRKIF